MATAEPEATGVVNLADEEAVRDPFAFYSRLREEGPLFRAELPDVEPFWIVTRYDDVKLVLGDPRFVVNLASIPGMAGKRDRMEQLQLGRGIPPELLKYPRASMAAADGADHLRLRRLTGQSFTVRRVAGWRPRIEQITERHLDRLAEVAAADGVVDLFAHFANPMPLTVIYELIGIPDEDRPRFLATIWEWTIGGGEFGKVTRRPRLESGLQDTRRLIERRRAEPADDLITDLVHAQDADGERISDTELVWLILTLVIAGHETTASLIANGVVALLTHPDQLDLLRRDPALMPRAVNELVRWCGPAVTAPHRYATEDVEIGGTRVPKGEGVMVILAGANRDPRAFEDPERLDITREPARNEPHLGFGHGLHYCLGAALGRLEAEVAFGALLRRFPDLALAVDPEGLTRARSAGMWKLLSLPVTI
ncbi:cytochrome P450 family protein [Actinomadura macra]|uniref:cytochrome P450 family protein n=1 Tax=Actinomadura macra TaxID=46164 RepID=UPI0008301DA8|nr:cytochrome P450 [Actinomadura macra]